MVRGVFLTFVAGACVSASAFGFGGDHFCEGEVTLRDHRGGEDSFGLPTGYYLTGTGGRPLGTATDGIIAPTRTGTFDFDINFGSGWQPFRTYILDPKLPIGFGVNLPDERGNGFNFSRIGDIDLGLGSIEPYRQANLERLWFHAFEFSTHSRAGAAAFQMVVWEIVWDWTLDFSFGNVKFSNTNSDPLTVEARAIGNRWLEELKGPGWQERTPLMGLVGACGNGGPFLIPSNVPSPGTWALGALASMIMLRRGRR